jgi:hypothetical protein
MFPILAVGVVLGGAIAAVVANSSSPERTSNTKSSESGSESKATPIDRRAVRESSQSNVEIVRRFVF